MSDSDSDRMERDRREAARNHMSLEDWQRLPLIEKEARRAISMAPAPIKPLSGRSYSPASSPEPPDVGTVQFSEPPRATARPIPKKPPSHGDDHEANLWLYGGLGGGIAITVLCVGLFGIFLEDRVIAGIGLTLVALLGAIAMALLIRGHRLGVAHVGIAMLVVTWAFFAYDIYTRQSTLETQQAMNQRALDFARSINEPALMVLRDENSSLKGQVYNLQKEVDALKKQLATMPPNSGAAPTAVPKP